MPRLVRRRLRCHYCNTYCAGDHSGIPRAWQCPHCDSMNHMDERGNLVDPPADSPPRQVQYGFAGPRSTSPSMQQPDASPFCDDCLQNQAIVNRLLSEYIPDESDPDYDRFVNTVDAYKGELETKYPPVCEKCSPHVREMIRRSGYTAKTEVMRRMLEQSKKNLAGLYTTRQLWTLRLTSLAKWAYISSTLVAICWHICGILTVSKYSSGVDFLHGCLLPAWDMRQVDRSCFAASEVLRVVAWATVADGLTLWWNPRLRQKTERPGGRMRGLMPLWLVRIVVLGLRVTSLLHWVNIPETTDALRSSTIGHSIILGGVILTILLNWTTVRIDYQSTSSFMKRVDSHLPSHTPPLRPVSRGSSRPGVTSFDTMAQSFTESFRSTDQPQQNAACLPPSPTLSPVSPSRDNEDETFTPYYERMSRANNAMDWTPTRRRVGKPVETIPSMFSQAPVEPARPGLHSHSLLDQKDPNPFRHRVPAAPARKGKSDPWKQPLFQPAPDYVKKTFFKEMMEKGQSSPGEREQHEQLLRQGPSRGQQEEQTFQQPQLKYDWYGFGTVNSTGLEDKFGDMFTR
ncbi:hypothetical protein EJ04DRAFT_126797 [Polyplosphaeria fusca]|uniref:Ima1 N-terminal domain-containing protein n=1 Tax=Polyplosphaeria fusca TaxID=682080 RepID=A0A9P4R0V9_9PLEO|nr:hypothetical protein EJ04DRAFT_126797 [Polyplosphaeria fusca]